MTLEEDGSGWRGSFIAGIQMRDNFGLSQDSDSEDGEKWPEFYGRTG